MLSRINSLLKKIIYPKRDVRAFVVTRLSPEEIKEKVFIKYNDQRINISERHGMICLEPFSLAIWLSPAELEMFDPVEITVMITKNDKTRAKLDLTLIEKTTEDNIVLLLYRVAEVKCFQGNPFYRFITLAWALKNRTSNYRERKFIAAFYTYPRKVIAVSYKEENYCNLFPMDIQGHVVESNLYLLGLRTTNITLNKILDTKKLLISDTSAADIKTIYSLGRHYSATPPKLEELPFSTSESKLLKFPVPDFAASYKELEIIRNVKIGYHMLLVAKIVNAEQVKRDTRSLYHIHFFEFNGSGYAGIANEGYS